MKADRNSTTTFGVVGYGSFGALLAELLAPYGKIKICDKRQVDNWNLSENVEVADFAEIAKCQVVFIATELNSIRSVCEELKAYVGEDTIVADICSVKVQPTAIMQEVLGGSCQLLATHPLFGPQTVLKRDDVKGNKLVWHELTDGDFSSLRQIFEDGLEVEIVELSPEEHDQEMAWVHGLTFFTGRALLNMKPPSSTLGTNYYQKLIDLVTVESEHSMELFMTIQRGNPYTDEIRLTFLKALEELEVTIKDEA